MSEKVITLPNREEMLKRLLRVSEDQHLQERFYPILLELAEKQYITEDVVMRLMTTIQNFVKSMPPIAMRMMYMRAPQFIDALVNDLDAASQAKTFLQKEYARSRN